MTYEGYSSAGRLETEAPSKAKAIQNMRWQLVRDYHWPRYKALREDLEPVRPVTTKPSH